MKTLPMLVVLLCLSLVATAQSTDAKFRQLNDSIIAFYNRGDYASIYGLGNNNFKMMQSAEGMAYELASLSAEAGNIRQTEIIERYPNGRSFKWIGEKKNLRFDFISLTGGDIDEYHLNDFIGQPDRLSERVLTDNQLKSRMDSIVDENASIYMSHPKTIGLSIGVLKNGKTYTYNYGEVKKGSGKVPTSLSSYKKIHITVG